jgi:antirestriction protein ArdC
MPCGIIRVTALCVLCRYRHNGHATGHGSRLDRQFGKRFGDDAYAAEELLAGLAQSILCAEYGLPNELHDSHASYIHHWAKLWRGEHNLANREVSIM